MPINYIVYRYRHYWGISLFGFFAALSVVLYAFSYLPAIIPLIAASHILAILAIGFTIRPLDYSIYLLYLSIGIILSCCITSAIIVFFPETWQLSFLVLAAMSIIYVFAYKKLTCKYHFKEYLLNVLDDLNDRDGIRYCDYADQSHKKFVMDLSNRYPISIRKFFLTLSVITLSLGIGLALFIFLSPITLSLAISLRVLLGAVSVFLMISSMLITPLGLWRGIIAGMVSTFMGTGIWLLYLHTDAYFSSWGGVLRALTLRGIGVGLACGLLLDGYYLWRRHSMSVTVGSFTRQESLHVTDTSLGDYLPLSDCNCCLCLHFSHLSDQNILSDKILPIFIKNIPLWQYILAGYIIKADGDVIVGLYCHPDLAASLTKFLEHKLMARGLANHYDIIPIPGDGRSFYDASLVPDAQETRQLQCRWILSQLDQRGYYMDEQYQLLFSMAFRTQENLNACMEKLSNLDMPGFAILEMSHDIASEDLPETLPYGVFIECSLTLHEGRILHTMNLLSAYAQDHHGILNNDWSLYDK